ncbi:MAG: prepilin-type N-terminal cleavage/methylation domain-containing protein [Candidatus Pacebacteria bacterium]|nr:prepilin-type N-terminal cleavage/methylation domain-containing protein [Candidatus Paceibacterota bacterium]
MIRKEIIKSRDFHAKGRASHAGGQASFTLVELVVVLGILAILATVTLLVVRPDQLFKQSRDTQRLSDLESINKALLLYRSVEGTSYGTANIVYVSLPDNSSTCATYALPALPAGWTYSCKTATNYRKVDGTGWIPVNFTSVSTTVGQMFAALPIDPTNTATDGFFYTYTTGSSWEIDAILESAKFRIGGSSDAVSTDGGDSCAVYEVGTVKTLSPYSDSGLVGYWKFEEGSGSTAIDSSGNNINGTWSGSAYSSGKVGSYSARFTGGGNYIDLGTTSSLDFNGSAMTISAWVKNSTTGTMHIFGQTAAYAVPDSSGYHFRLYDMQYWGGNSTQVKTGFEAGGIGFWTNGPSSGAPVINDGVWHQVTIAITTSNIKTYQDGTLVGTVTNAISITDHGSNYTMGVKMPSGGEAFNGLLDDVRIYNRAFSAAEVLALYNATK